MATYESDIILGDEYQDKITEVVGVATSVHFYRNACERVILTYKNKGMVVDASFDATDLIHQESGAEVESERPGGPERTMPPRR
jgi:hypothetical protein